MAFPEPLVKKAGRLVQPLVDSDPSHIGPFRLTHQLGAGGMGQVYLARNRAGRKVAVKIIRPEHLRSTNEDDFRARFAREAEAARRVGGFHTAQIVDADPEAKAPWIASEYIVGPSLAQAVTDHGPLTEPALGVLAAGLAEGLEAIHGCDLVHRDLKPGNIILAQDGPRIIDFGIAHQLDGGHLTTTGRAIGTPAYFSPEQAKGERVGPASDVFSLGTVLNFAATGASPFDAGTDNLVTIALRLVSPAPDPAGVPGVLRELIAVCWNQDPDQRPELGRILSALGQVDPDQSWPPHQLRRRTSFDSTTDGQDQSTPVARVVPTRHYTAAEPAAPASDCLPVHSPAPLRKRKTPASPPRSPPSLPDIRAG